MLIACACLDMGMRNPIPTYSYIISELAKHYPNLAYIHMIEPGIEGIIEGAPQTLEEGIIVSSLHPHSLMKKY